MKRVNTFVLIVCLISLTGMWLVGYAAGARAQSTIAILHDGDMAKCICGLATPTVVSPLSTPTVTTPGPTSGPALIPTIDSPAPTATPTATPEPTGTPKPTLAPSTPTPEPVAGKPFGPFDWPPGNDWPFTAPRLGYLNSGRLARIEAAEVCGGQ